jgi:choline dehydrogenase-like flavoprotein
MNKRVDPVDVCIIGAGLAGGIMAFELARRGVTVAVLEAGLRHDLGRRHQYMMDALQKGESPWASNRPERDLFTNSGPVHYPLNDKRVKAFGGSSLHWGANTSRYMEPDFEMKSRYGIADDWPISYRELEPFYGKAERLLGVAGITDNPFASFRSSDYPLPHFPHSYSDKLLMPQLDKAGVKFHHLAFARNTKPYDGRPGCMAFSTCGTKRVCPIVAQYTSENHLDRAVATGKATVELDANVVKLSANKEGRVVAARYVNGDGRETEQKASVFVLAAHAVESARLLLLSSSALYPDGLANSSGQVGRNFMEHPGITVSGKIDKKIYPYRIGFHTAECHQFCDHDNRSNVSAFKLSILNNVGQKPEDLVSHTGVWGDDLANEIREEFGTYVGFYAQFEQLPGTGNVITLNKDVLDVFGNPVPDINYSFAQYETDGLQMALGVLESLFDAVGATDVVYPTNFAGFPSHHMGTCRMGSDPDKSVVDRDLKAHDVKNLYVVGSSVFTTGGTLHPSLTISALAIRAAETIANNAPRK